MTVRPPSNLFQRGAPKAPQDALEYELAQEKAFALGRMGRRLEAALAALSAFDAAREPGAALPAEDKRERAGLVADAGVALWHFVVQREALGLRDSARLMRDYRVPAEVRDRMGAFPSRDG
ncbi:MAG TPA: DUF6665 family protein [Xanthobacteraceae bacterium]|jgi:hypothetical protein